MRMRTRTRHSFCKQIIMNLVFASFIRLAATSMPLLIQSREIEILLIGGCCLCFIDPYFFQKFSNVEDIDFHSQYTLDSQP